MIKRYQYVLALCALLTGVILKELFKNVCLMFVYVCFVLCLRRDRFCGLTCEHIYVNNYKRVWKCEFKK